MNQSFETSQRLLRPLDIGSCPWFLWHLTPSQCFQLVSYFLVSSPRPSSGLDTLGLIINPSPAAAVSPSQPPLPNDAATAASAAGSRKTSSEQRMAAVSGMFSPDIAKLADLSSLETPQVLLHASVDLIHHWIIVALVCIKCSRILLSEFTLGM